MLTRQAVRLSPAQLRTATLCRLVLVLATLVLSGCAHNPRKNSVNGEVAALLQAQRSPIGGSRQVLLVTNDDGGRFVRVGLLERATTREPWSCVLGPVPGVVGSGGFAPPGLKREGDRRTPTGAFTLTEAFGSESIAPTRLPYHHATQADAWCDDPSSAKYNQLVSGAEAEGLTDRLLRDDRAYRVAVVIDYNRWPAQPGLGSAIFLHRADPQGAGTLGCVGLEREDLQRVVERLDPARKPMIVMGSRGTLIKEAGAAAFGR